MAGAPRDPARTGGAILLGVLVLAGYAASLPALLGVWGAGFARARGWLDLRVMLGEQEVGLPGGAFLRVPELAAVTPQPTDPVLLTATAISLLVLAGTFLLPDRLAPLRSFFRLLVVVQASAILFFAASPEPFPYRLSDYLFGLMATGLVAMGMVPMVLALTLYHLDLVWWRKLAVTGFLLGHFAVLTPLLVLLHASAILHGTAILIPVLFVGFGVLPFALVFLGGYGWAMSGASEPERRRVPAPIHSA